jgi:hypothetical protein
MPTLSGRVLVGGEQAAFDAVVELHNSSDDVVDQVQVDSTGRYKFHLSEGSWSLRSWDPHGHRAEGLASLGPDEDVSLDLRLESSSTT